MSLDPRLNAFRADLADARLAGRVEAARFVEGMPRRVRAPSAPLKRKPGPDAPLDSELLRGEEVLVFDEDAEGWSWVQNRADSYVGYVPTDSLGGSGAPSHTVVALRTFIYPGPDMKFPALAALSIGSAVTVVGEAETRGTRFGLLAGGEGAVVLRHLSAAMPVAEDFVTVAEGFLNVPYLWGGRTSLGLDCSALVQLSLMMAGRRCPRDTDMQRQALGSEIGAGEGRRGDLAFWHGHVAILTDSAHIVHASGHHMTVVKEALADAVARIGQPAFIRIGT